MYVSIKQLIVYFTSHRRDKFASECASVLMRLLFAFEHKFIAFGYIQEETNQLQHRINNIFTSTNSQQFFKLSKTTSRAEHECVPSSSILLRCNYVTKLSFWCVESNHKPRVNHTHTSSSPRDDITFPQSKHPSTYYISLAMGSRLPTLIYTGTSYSDVEFCI